jgi:choline kinase
MTGRPNVFHTSSSSASLAKQASSLTLNDQANLSDSFFDSQPQNDPRKTIAQVVDWLHKEKSKRHKHKLTQYQAKTPVDGHVPSPDDTDGLPPSESGPDSDLALDKLETILGSYVKTMAARSPLQTPKSPLLGALRKSSIASKFKRKNSMVQPSSDTEFFGDEVMVPNVEASLDNSKTLAYTGGSGEEVATGGKQSKHWVVFKEDILRLTHTLKLKGWRRIPMDRAGDLEVTRLSGALTNCVYIVKPPQMNPSDSKPTGRTHPRFLLLRIYGPQVEHLIDRDSELAILRRLAQKKIGPRLLGTFTNGRFEEYLHARTLTAEDLRIPETSKQIAKRMRELHDGIELLDAEYHAGPTIFITWDKWVDRCEKVISWLDAQVALAQHPQEGVAAPPKKYTRYGLICGSPWSQFRATYDAYRAELLRQCGGAGPMRKKLVFAHNDTQYGNLMRLTPQGESPLLQPSNHHKQLVVIDFEYAGQNTAGLEFANHFTEWCYNYHHPDLAWACHTQGYPSVEEQTRFVRSYVMHRPQFNPSASSTPKVEARERTNIPEFMLDARAAPNSNSASAFGAGQGDYESEERMREERQQAEIERLLTETRLWRMANTAQWVAWGIVQADIPELNEVDESRLDKARAVLGRVVEGVQSRLPHRAEKERRREDGVGVVKPMSDPLSEEDRAHQRDAASDRPEGRAQELAHHEGDEVSAGGAHGVSGSAEESGAENEQEGRGSQGEKEGGGGGEEEEEEEEEEPINQEQHRAQPGAMQE